MKKSITLLLMTLCTLLFSCQTTDTSVFEDPGVPFEQRNRPMRILLINDDGYDNEGIQVLYHTLEDRGYDVWLVAPITNKSGIGTAVTFNEKTPLQFESYSEKKFALEGTPSDCFKFAISTVMKDQLPDLVISGINDGPNVGEAQFNSGTVGGAARAARHGFPSIAASIGVPGDLPLEVYIAPAAEFVATIVDNFYDTWKTGNLFLPKGVGLSINYPALPSAQIQGIVHIPNQPYYTNGQSFVINEDGTVSTYMDIPAFMEILSNAEYSTDLTELFKGYVTITTFEASWNGSAEQVEFVEKQLSDIQIIKSDF